MGDDHDHGTGLARAGERHRGRLAAAFVVIFTFFIVEAVAGFATNSLALLSDAGHMLTDVIGIGHGARRHPVGLPVRDPSSCAVDHPTPSVSTDSRSWPRS